MQTEASSVANANGANGDNGYAVTSLSGGPLVPNSLVLKSLPVGSSSYLHTS
jgi:hypothetical protein